MTSTAAELEARIFMASARSLRFVNDKGADDKCGNCSIENKYRKCNNIDNIHPDSNCMMQNVI